MSCQETETKPNKVRRSRAGCLSCRRRHKKCDEAKPICKSCELRNAFCEWPIKGVFKTKNINSRKKSFNNQMPGTNYHQLINGELNKLLETSYLPTGESMMDFNSEAHVLPAELEETSFLDPSLELLGRNAAAVDPAVDYAYLASFNEQSLWNARSGSISSGSSVTTPPSSLFGNEGSSPASDVDLSSCGKDEGEENLLKSFQFTCSSQFLKVPDSSMFEASHNLLRTYMYANVMLDAPADAPTETSAGLVLSEALSSNVKKLEYFRVLLKQANMLEMANGSNIITIQEKNHLVQNFISNVMPLLHISSCTKSLINKVLITALTSDTNSEKPRDDYVICSILALSSRIQDLKEQNSSPNTLKLYNKALRLLICTMDPEKESPGASEQISVLCGCLLLFFFQIMSSSPRHFKRHLESMFLFMKLFKINGFNNKKGVSGKLNKTYDQLFWLFVRLDLHFSLSLNEPTLISPGAYLPQEFFAGKNGGKCPALADVRGYFFCTGGNEEQDEEYADNYSNYLCYLSCRTIQLIYNVNSLTNEEYINEWNLFSSEFNYWHQHRPVELQSIVNNNNIDNSNHSLLEVVPPCLDIKFPIILYNDSSATFTNQMFHAMSILLAQNNKSPHFHNSTPSLQDSALTDLIINAVKVIGISLNDTNQASLSFSLPFIYIASNLLTKNSNRKTNNLLFNYDSKIIMKKLLRTEQKNSWPLRWKFSDF